MSGIPEQIAGYRIEWVLGFGGISRCAGAGLGRSASSSRRDIVQAPAGFL